MLGVGRFIIQFLIRLSPSTYTYTKPSYTYIHHRKSAYCHQKLMMKGSTTANMSPISATLPTYLSPNRGRTPRKNSKMRCEGGWNMLRSCINFSIRKHGCGASNALRISTDKVSFLNPSQTVICDYINTGSLSKNYSYSNSTDAVLQLGIVKVSCSLTST